jgi:pimeloyl-ACP methyl ester carboxylesterase
LAISFQLHSQGVKREIVWSDYPYPIAEEHKEKIRFGHIVVPETRNSSNPRTLKIAFCLIKGKNDKGMENPAIVLPGGPGQSATERSAGFLEAEHWKERLEFMDIVLFDPRGCGKSEPDLCPGMDAPEVYYQTLLGKTADDMNQLTIQTLKKCLDSLTLEKVDLNAYGSDEIAEDIEDLRVSIGVKQWNVNGASYGTRYGQGLIRKFPNTVKSAVFIGLVPTVREYEDDNLRSLSKSLQLVLKKCADDPSCANEYPNLEEKLFSALDYYDKNPLVIPASEQKLVQSQDVIINGEVIVSGLFILSYGPFGLEIIPKFIDALAERNEWVIRNFVNSIGDTFEGNQDMYFFITSNDNPEYGLSPEVSNYNAFTKRLMPYMVFPDLKSPRELAQFAGIELDTTQHVPIPSEVPVLLSTGIYDPVTPTENTIVTSKYLTNSVVLNFPEDGHWSRGNPCFSDVITSFYKTAELPVDAEACQEEGIPLELVVDITDNKGIVLLGSKIFKGDQNEVYIPFGVSLLLVLIGFLGLPLYALIRFLKKRKNKELTREPFMWTPWIMTFFTLCFVALFATGLKASIDRNFYILGFGILSSWNWVFWIMGLVILLLAYTAIRRKDMADGTSKTNRSLGLIGWIGTLVFSGLLIYWNVLWPF